MIILSLKQSTTGNGGQQHSGINLQDLIGMIRSAEKSMSYLNLNHSYYYRLLLYTVIIIKNEGESVLINRYKMWNRIFESTALYLAEN